MKRRNWSYRRETGDSSGGFEQNKVSSRDLPPASDIPNVILPLAG